MLIGEYRHIIDNKKRLALPAKFRKELGESVIVTKWFEKCLVVYTQEAWKKIADKITQLPIGRAQARGFTRIVLGEAMQVSLYGLGRILIPDYLKQYGELKKNVVVCGMGDRLEVWDQALWDEYSIKMERELERSASEFGDLGI